MTPTPTNTIKFPGTLPPFKTLVVARNHEQFHAYITENRLDPSLYIYAPHVVALCGLALSPSIRLLKLPGWQYDKSDEFIQRLAAMEAAYQTTLN